ncbi:hypothetical protein TWF730_011139 [Orbilia blumenaviensis]|uniref:Secreted protein n=1 Tax=Orbilia blumenaviensis TaxID=1796055 RepID=A0AAV9UKA5_9PEZI
MSPVKNLPSCFLAFILCSAANVGFALSSGLLPSTSGQPQRENHLDKHPIGGDDQEPISKPQQDAFSSPGSSSEGVAIVDWKSYVDASRYNFALNNWQSLKNDPNMIERYGGDGPSVENMPRVLCLVDSSPLGSDRGEALKTYGCTWDQVHNPDPSQRWHIRYTYLSDNEGSVDGSPKWAASFRNNETERCIRADHDINRQPNKIARRANTVELFRSKKIVPGKCSTDKNSTTNLNFEIQRCTNSQDAASGEDETNEIFRNWSLCIYPSRRSLEYGEGDDWLPQNPCPSPNFQENLLHALDRPSLVEWGCGQNTWYLPTQALSVDKIEGEWNWL